MFDLGWSEIFVIGAVTLIVVGPREIPRVLAGVARAMRKIRGMIQGFQDSVDDVVRQVDVAEFHEYKKSIGADIEQDDLAKNWNMDWDAELETLRNDSPKTNTPKKESDFTKNKNKKKKVIKVKKSGAKKSMVKKSRAKKSRQRKSAKYSTKKT